MPHKKISELEIERIPEVVATIRRQGFKVTQKAVARELGTDEYSFCRLLSQFPEVRDIYDDAVALAKHLYG